MHRQIKKSTKQSLIDKISKIILELELKKKSLNKIRMRKFHCQKEYCHHYKTCKSLLRS